MSSRNILKLLSQGPQPVSGDKPRMIVAELNQDAGRGWGLCGTDPSTQRGEKQRQAGCLGYTPDIRGGGRARQGRFTVVCRKNNTIIN